VQQTRFSDRLSISIDASPESRALRAIALLQPLARTRLNTAANEGGPTLHVRVAASLVAERLCIVVNNSSPQLRTDLSAANYDMGCRTWSCGLRAAYATTRA